MSFRNVQLQERDFELLYGLFESRVMTLRHIAAIHFGGHREMAKKRVQLLKVTGYIGERSRSPQDASILSLTQKAFELLKAEGRLGSYSRMGWAAVSKRIRVSDLTLRHEVEVMDVKTAFYDALRAHRTVRLVEFSTWPKRFEFNTLHPATGTRVKIKPDGFFRLCIKSDGGVHESFFFLELDRSTEKLDILVSKALCYRDYYRQGGFAARFGKRPEAYKVFPFRVLIVCQSDERSENLAARLLMLHPPIRSFVVLTTLEAISVNPLGALLGQQDVSI